MDPGLVVFQGLSGVQRVANVRADAFHELQGDPVEPVSAGELRRARGLYDPRMGLHKLIRIPGEGRTLHEPGATELVRGWHQEPPVGTIARSACERENHCFAILLPEADKAVLAAYAPAGGDSPDCLPIFEKIWPQMEDISRNDIAQIDQFDTPGT